MRKEWTTEHVAHLRKWVGIKTAAAIAADLGRTEQSILKMMGRLGLTGIKRGEKHRLVKCNRQGVLMIRTLYEADFLPADIFTLFQTRPTLRMVQDICAGRTWGKVE